MVLIYGSKKREKKFNFHKRPKRKKIATERNFFILPLMTHLTKKIGSQYKGELFPRKNSWEKNAELEKNEEQKMSLCEVLK